MFVRIPPAKAVVAVASITATLINLTLYILNTFKKLGCKGKYIVPYFLVNKHIINIFYAQSYRICAQISGFVQFFGIIDQIERYKKK